MPTPITLKHASAALEIKAADDNGRIEGIASAFHVVDSDDDVIMPGAFTSSLKARNGNPLPMLWQHNSGEPIGVWTEFREDESGLYLSGRLLVDDVAKAREARALAKAGALGGLSVGFMIEERKPRQDSMRGGEEIYKADLWETSLVTFKANPAARITEVKSALDAGSLPSVRDFERMLTRDAGFTRSQALTIIREGFDALATRDAGDDADDEELAQAMRRIIASIKEATP